MDRKLKKFKRVLAIGAVVILLFGFTDIFVLSISSIGANDTEANNGLKY